MQIPWLRFPLRLAYCYSLGSRYYLPAFDKETHFCRGGNSFSEALTIQTPFSGMLISGGNCYSVDVMGEDMVTCHRLNGFPTANRM